MKRKMFSIRNQAGMLALMTWIALFVNAINIISNSIYPAGETFLRLLSNYSMVTNLMVAVACSFLYFTKGLGSGQFFIKASVLTAIAVYVSVAAISYNIFFRFAWNASGANLLINEVMHTLIPIFFLSFWWNATARITMKWTSVFHWLVFPTLYLAFIIIRGDASGFFPYALLNADHLGMAVALSNALILVVMFAVVAFLLVAVGKWLSEQNRETRFTY